MEVQKHQVFAWDSSQKVLDNSYVNEIPNSLNSIEGGVVRPKDVYPFSHYFITTMAGGGKK
jgi:hypothetical protein